MRLPTAGLVERIRSSLFFVPMVGVLTAVVSAILVLLVDQNVDGTDLPLGLASTVESARAVLSTVASATITFAGIAFSISLVVVQQAANQHSPRIVQTIFRDPFNRRVMALVVGTFTYCLIVLRSVRSSLEPDGDPIIPNLSVGLAVVLGVATILAVVAFINHSAHSMNVSELLERARHDTVEQIRAQAASADDGRAARDRTLPADHGVWLVRFDSSGWVQHLDVDALLDSLPPNATMHVRTHPGRYAVDGSVACSLSVVPVDADAVGASIRRAITIGSTRTLGQDPAYGLRELADVALRALSPGVNDPTTAQDAIFHSAAVLAELLRHEPSDAVRCGPDGRRVVLAAQPTHDDLVRLAFDEVRRAAADQPAVCVYLLEALALVDDSATAAGRVNHRTVLREQADLVLAGCEQAGPLRADLERVRAAHRRHVGPLATGPGPA